MSFVPVIDLTNLENAEQRKALVRQIKDALENVGFMYVVGHGVSLSLIQRVEEWTKKFFLLPKSEKSLLTRRKFNQNNSHVYRGYFPAQQGLDSYKEGFDMGMVSNPEIAASKGKLAVLWEADVWPKESLLPGFRQDMEQYFQALYQLGRALVRAMAESLNLGPEFFDPFFESSMSSLRLLHYPTNPNFQSGELSCVEHTDSGVLTFILQDEAGGLQVQERAIHKWHDVPHIPNSFVVNTGDLLETWTGGKFKATCHRVCAISTTRYSIPYFFAPGGDAAIQRIPGCEYPNGLPNEGVVYAQLLYDKISTFDEYLEDDAANQAPK